jgi:hypothetical protein
LDAHIYGLLALLSPFAPVERGAVPNGQIDSGFYAEDTTWSHGYEFAFAVDVT